MATAPSTSPPRPADATSTPRSRGSSRRHARRLCRLAQGRRVACACACEPGAVVLEAAAPSAHCSTHSPSRTAPSTPSWSSATHDRHSKHHRGLHAGAASRHGSTTSPPPARRQPTLTRVALTCIYTARTTHSRHRLPLAARFHSNARAPADTFLVPARSPRKTRPSRRPPRSARPLVRPTSFMRTTTPRPPPAKALRMMSRLRCAQSLHECEPGTRGLQFPPSTAPLLPRGRV